MSDPKRSALASLLRRTRAQRMAQGDGEEKPAGGMLISIGVSPNAGEDYVKDPRGGPQDPDAEIYGDATDDDEELPGVVRKRPRT